MGSNDMRLFMGLLSVLVVCSSLTGCGLAPKPKPKLVVKRVYVKTPTPPAPAECKEDYAALKPLPKTATLNDMTQEVAVQRAGRLKDRASFTVCKTYANKVSSKK